MVKLFHDWRAFERPPLRDGAPDYTAARFTAAHAELKHYQARLHAIDTSQWPVDKQVDWQIVQAEMNGFDFNHRVLQPWVRDPAFYQTLWMEQSDVPDHEGPTNHATVEVWQYRFPLSPADQDKLARELAVIPPLLKQARENLNGNAKDLWNAGINNMVQQQADLQWLAEQTQANASDALKAAIAAGMTATAEFTRWLQAQAPSKTGPSGIGKENYTWYQQHVHLVPLTWDQEVALLQRELDRAWANLKLEEQRNAHLPPMKAANTPAEYAQLADHSASKLMRFLAAKQVMPIKANMEPALRAHLLDFVPEDKRNFFDIGRHYDPLPQYCHWYHWFELAQVRDEPHVSPIRRGPLLYNIWDSRNEGIATGVEEMFMHMGLHDDNPRTREIVWTMLAQRAARGLGSLYAHANLMTMEEASQVHLQWTPRNWMRREPELLKFEQHLYLRQPGYGTSYVVGKYLIERLMAQRAKQLEQQNKPFVMKDFFQAFNDYGNIPVALTNKQLLAS
ncbi:DUF885 family protein [Permianibacter sp. IMCC34836]|nr:DUF885 family protein [Permianibacter fluminis]